MHSLNWCGSLMMLPSNRKAIQWNGQRSLEAVPSPVVLDLAAELIGNAALGQSAAKAATLRNSNNRGTANLLPVKVEAAILHLPFDADRSARFRECAVFRGIGRTLMQSEREARNGLRANRHIGSAYDDAVIGALGVGLQNRSHKRIDCCPLALVFRTH